MITCPRSPGGTHRHGEFLFWVDENLDLCNGNTNKTRILTNAPTWTSWNWVEPWVCRFPTLFPLTMLGKNVKAGLLPALLCIPVGGSNWSYSRKPFYALWRNTQGRPLDDVPPQSTLPQLLIRKARKPNAAHAKQPTRALQASSVIQSSTSMDHGATQQKHRVLRVSRHAYRACQTKFHFVVRLAGREQWNKTSHTLPTICGVTHISTGWGEGPACV